MYYRCDRLVSSYSRWIHVEALLRAFSRAECEPPVEDLVSLARLVLENNYFGFDEKTFRRKLGTAIGTKFALGFANIFMGFLEKNFLETCELKPWVWWHFLDDIFLIWLHSEEKLNNFLLRWNSFHENIRYTWKVSYQRISFLDVLGSLMGYFVLMCVVNLQIKSVFLSP